MRYFTIGLLVVLPAVALFADEDKPAVKPPKAAIPAMPLMVRGGIQNRPAELSRIKLSYLRACGEFVERLAAAETAEAKSQILQEMPSPASFALSAARIAAEKPSDDVAFEALEWLLEFQHIPAVKRALQAVVTGRDKPPVHVDPIAWLIEHHLDNPKLGNLLNLNSLDESLPGFDTLLNAAAERSRQAATRGTAIYRLASILGRKGNDEKLSTAERESFDKQAEALLEKLIGDENLAAVESANGTLGEVAASELHEIRFLKIGKSAPDFQGEDLDGKVRKLSDYRGKVVVLDVWTTWCGPCRAMIPHEREMVQHLEGKPFALISVSCDNEKEALAEFLKKESMPWSHWWVGHGGEFSKQANIRFYPTIFVLDGKGTIRFKNIRNAELQKAVEQLLAEMDGKTGGQ